jgi:catalase
MQKALSKASEVITGAMQSNQKAVDMKHEIHEPTSSEPLTSDFGVKSTSHDIWLSASTGDRKGPQLLEDNFGREKVGSQHSLALRSLPAANENSDHEIRP